MGDYIIIHKETAFKGTYIEKEGVIQGCTPKGRLCNPYDDESVTTRNNIDVTCKNCTRILTKTDRLKGYELKIMENVRGGWKVHIPHTRYGKEFMEKVDRAIDSFGIDKKASFKAYYMKNGGYSKNKETGSTQIVYWDGLLGEIYNLYRDFPDPDEVPTPLEEYAEKGHKAFNKKDEYPHIEKVWKCSDCGKMKPRWHRRDAKCDDCGSTKYEQDGDLRWDVPKDTGDEP